MTNTTLPSLASALLIAIAVASAPACLRPCVLTEEILVSVRDSADCADASCNVTDATVVAARDGGEVACPLDADTRTYVCGMSGTVTVTVTRAGFATASETVTTEPDGSGCGGGGTGEVTLLLAPEE